MPRAHERLKAVESMLEHLQKNYKWETEWDHNSEDWYSGGEMLSYRRIAHPSDDSCHACFIFSEYGENSSCYVTAENMSTTIFTKDEYEKVIAALGERKGAFANLCSTQ